MNTPVFHQPDESPRRERTAAQREASRLNGAKSRGPILHKARLAATVVPAQGYADGYLPPADHRGLDEEYRRIRN